MSDHEEQVKKIWMLSREYGELAGAGGVKDVVSQLAEALARWNGRSLHVVLPLYGFVNAREQGFKPLPDPFCPESRLFACRSICINRIDAYLKKFIIITKKSTR